MMCCMSKDSLGDNVSRPDCAYAIVIPKDISSVTNRIEQGDSRETNDFVSLFIDTCYIFIGNEPSYSFQ
jgi:hypothetical protein